MAAAPPDETVRTGLDVPMEGLLWQQGCRPPRSPAIETLTPAREPHAELDAARPRALRARRGAWTAPLLRMSRTGDGYEAQEAITLLDQIDAGARTIELPTLDASLTAIGQVKDVKDKP